MKYTKQLTNIGIIGFAISIIGFVGFMLNLWVWRVLLWDNIYSFTAFILMIFGFILVLISEILKKVNKE